MKPILKISNFKAKKFYLNSEMAFLNQNFIPEISKKPFY